MNNSTSWKHWFASLPARIAAERDRRQAERARAPTAAQQADRSRLDALMDELMRDPPALGWSPVFLAFMAGEPSADTLWAGQAPPRHVCDDDTLRAIFRLLLYEFLSFDILLTWDPVTGTYRAASYRLREPRPADADGEWN